MPSVGQVVELNRRTFVGASIAVGGAVATAPLLAGCGEDERANKSTSSAVRLRVNGEDREIEVDNRTSLLDTLRERAGLPGTKKGCDQGACGACTILANGQRVVSCLTLAVMHDGAEITTIEGLEHNGRLHPLQQAFIDEQAAQCGYCLNGMIMSAKALLERNPEPDDDAIRDALRFNLCRCGTHFEIVNAVRRAAQYLRHEGAHESGR